MPRLVLATANPGKVIEFQTYLPDWECLPRPAVLEIEETGDTFLANACLKATHIARLTGEWAIADDSGLMVDALDGSPGLYSARYGTTDTERIERLLFELGDELERSARFVCALAVADPAGTILAQAEGVCEGEILRAPRGNGGFGYDPIFYVPDQGLTFAQMTPDLKRQVGHRGRALTALQPQLQTFV